MHGFFPRQTAEIHLEEPAAFRRFSFSLWETAIVTGVMTRLYRSLVLTHGNSSFLYLGATFALGMLFYFGMCTAHLANFPLHRWRWRAPAFAAVAVAGEMATSALLIALGREPNGTVRAEWADWPGMLGSALVFRLVAICLYVLLLAGIVLLVRRSGVSVPDLEDEAEEPVAH